MPTFTFIGVCCRLVYPAWVEAKNSAKKTNCPYGVAALFNAGQDQLSPAFAFIHQDSVPNKREPPPVVNQWLITGYELRFVSKIRKDGDLTQLLSKSFVRTGQMQFDVNELTNRCRCSFLVSQSVQQQLLAFAHVANDADTLVVAAIGKGPAFTEHCLELFSDDRCAYNVGSLVAL